MKNLLLFIAFISLVNVQAQDTFSIVAMDPETNEVGSAGASCVDLDAFNIPTDDFLGELFPSLGAINTQAWYVPANQENARDRMNLGDTPSEIIDWLINNDISNQPELRQYGIVALVDETIETAAHTGTSTDDYKNHITGSNYSIQGNILLGQEVLDDMETEFNNAQGNLACKLMAALQGAKRVGADSRCAVNGTSSLFAFVKVAQPTDVFGSPSFLVSVRTGGSDGVEPIDELQALFDIENSCSLGINNQEDFNSKVLLYPNPTNDYLQIELVDYSETSELSIISVTGNLVYKNQFIAKTGVEVSQLQKGVYFVKVVNPNFSVISKWIKN
ncbi:MAG: DUF1028 domain-containing protein [Flavobacteriales bacterium]